MRKMLGILIIAAFAASGCLRKETTHTLYLRPDGSVTWTVIEKDVRSDYTDLTRRMAEEESYASAAATGVHPVGAALSALRAERLRTEMVRRERPFLTITEGEFGGIDTLAQSILAELRLRGDVRLVRSGPKATLSIKIDVSDVDDSAETPVVDLIEDLDRYRIVLTVGRFADATGFEIVDGGMQAIPIEISPEQIAAAGGMIALSLTWTSEF